MEDNENKVEGEIQPAQETTVSSETQSGEVKKPEKKKGGLLKIIIFVVVIAAAVIIAYVTGLTDRIQDIAGMRVWFENFGFWGYLVFIVLYVVAATFMLPAFPFTLVAGLVFGSILGGLLSLIAATIGAVFAFIIARYVARDTIVSKFGSSPLFKKIDDGLRDNGVSFLILTRLVPIFPYNVQNYIYGLTPIKLGTYALVSFICMAPGAFIYAFLAGIIIEEGITPMLAVYFAGAGVVLFLVSLIPKYIAKKKGIKLQDDE
ncbi:MAG: TVP38/TMEM64 family protein [Oscillospiraceae bacterium]|nr:TVP38/TMEM64 family protein [Oscillospiraceae bacterium]